MIKYISIASFVFILTGCLDNSATNTDPAMAKDLVNSMVYVKAQNGLCFGVASFDKIDTGAKASTTQVVVSVDCNKIGL